MDYDLNRLEQVAKLEAAGDWDGMLEHCRAWASTEPRNFLAWQGIGDALRKLGQPKEALLMYRKGLEFAPPVPMPLMGASISAGQLWYRIGRTYQAMGDASSAIESLQEAIAIDSTVAEVWNELGVAHAACGHKRPAFDAFMSAVRLAPRNVTALQNLGLCYAANGQEEEAMKVHQLLGVLDPGAAAEFRENAVRLVMKAQT